MAISKESIWMVADELDAVGDKPTLAIVRKRLGGGSYTTISEAMSEWNVRKASRNATKIEAPERVEEAAKDFAQAVWAAASEIAESRLAREREVLEATRGAFEEERQETAAFADSLNAELEAANKRIDALDREVESAHRERDTVREERESERARGDRAEATAVERLGHIESLKSELEHVRKDRDAEIARLVALLQTQSETKKN